MKLEQWIISLITGVLIFLIGLFIGHMTFLPALFNGFNGFIGFLGIAIVSARSSKKRKK
ncbi:hypothetical protein [Staphylococcus coagulans]|uniref:hypothetical protein n=1 Tax=Staphylococcus coagulans TaxID=74706 RepID=UPI0015F93897|nr:hypothetical protein [Staphylococcus coagulans]